MSMPSATLLVPLKGRGFAGVMKRHGFGGLPATHGAKGHRHGGSIGCRMDPW